MALVMELGLNEGSGTTTTDASGNGFNCTVGGGGWATGHTDGGYAPTNADLVQWPVLGFGGSVFTILAWVYRTGAPGSATTVCSAGTASGARWNLQNDGSIIALGGRTSGVIPLNTWTHVAFVADGSTNRTCYVDGVLVDQDSGSSAFISASTAYALTSNATAYLAWDDARVFDHALTQGEVQTQMATPVGGGAGGIEHPATGTVAVTTAITGSPTARLVAAGTIAVLTAASGTAAAVHPATGTVAVTTGAAGTPTALHPASGTIPVTTTASGTADVQPDDGGYTATGTIPVVTGASGTANQRHAASGTVAVTTSAAGAPAGRYAAAGTCAVVSAATGSPAGRYVASGTVIVVTAASGTANVFDPSIPPLPTEGVSLTVSTGVRTLTVDTGPARTLTVTTGVSEFPPDTTVDVTFTLSAETQPRVILTAEDDAGIEWLDGETVLSTSLTPTLPAGTVTMRASSATAVHSVNFGFAHTEDAGLYNIGSGYNWPTQPLTGVTGLNGLTGLTYFMCNSTTLVGALDLSGMASLEHLECFRARLTSVNLTGCDSLIRLCVEANRLTALDLNPVAATLRDLRAALNNNIAFATQTEPLVALYHHCTRGQAATNLIPFSMLPVVEEYWVWNSSATTLPVPTHTTVRSYLAYSNALTEASVNDILIAFDTLGRATGNVQLNLGTSAAPTGAGAIAAANLVGKGWNVVTN